MADIAVSRRKRSVSAKPKPHPVDDERVKALVSISADELRRIDARADAAHMTRSAYIVEMTLREEVGLVSAIETLRRELNRFAADNVGWKGEVSALRKHSDRREKAIAAAQSIVHEALSDIEKRNRAGEPASSAAVLKALRAISQSLG
jgi:hypothetical protein